MAQQDFEIDGIEGIGDGEMRQVRAGDTDVLVANVGGRICAVGAFCPHYHAPLVDGVLNGARLVCPWHQAAFDVTTGAVEEPPALGGLPCYEVRHEDRRLIVSIPIADQETAPPDRASRSDERTFVILGGGAAGCSAAQALREEGFRGRIAMITREQALPYDRPNLSKDYLAGTAQPEWLPLKDDAFFEEQDIEVLRGRTVVGLDADARRITLDGGEQLVYDTALLATGAIAKRPPIPGVDLGNVFTLRSLEDADAISSAAASGARAVVVGASFIAMEAAASLSERGLAVTVVAPDAVPFERTLGREIGAMFRALHEAHGVRFELEASVTRFEGDGSVREVVLDTGARLAADLVVLGVGVRTATEFVRGVALQEDGSIPVDEHLCARDGLYVAGDAASFPDPRTGATSRIEHWRTAEQQGRIAAQNMAGTAVAYAAVPFFWTTQFGEGIQYVGHTPTWDEILVDGRVADREFLACYVKDGKILAAAASKRDRDMAAIAELMRTVGMPPADTVRAGRVDWPGLLRKAHGAGGSG